MYMYAWVRVRAAQPRLHGPSKRGSLELLKVDRSLVSQPASSPRVAVPRWRRRRAGSATPSDGWGHPAMPESRLTGHSARARRR